MIYFAVDEIRTRLLENYLRGEWGAPLRGIIGQVADPELFRRRNLPRGVWVFAALDSLSDAELEMVHHIQTSARTAGLRVLNPAREALRRYDLLRALHDAGLNEFRAHRADGAWDSIRFPVFVRMTNEHTGSLTPLLRNRAELRRAMAYLWMRGLSRSQLLIMEFCDTAGAGGLYRKYSIFRVGDYYVPKYLHIGSEWMTKERTRKIDKALAREELDYITGNPHQEWVRRTFDMAQVQYGRLDYGIRDGRPQVWEINFTPVLCGDPDAPPAPADAYDRSLVRPAKEYAHRAMREAFLSLDPGPIPGGDISVAFPPGLDEQARWERRAIGRLARRRERIERLANATGFRPICRWIREHALSAR